jgi:hypothetical protein
MTHAPDAAVVARAAAFTHAAAPDREPGATVTRGWREASAWRRGVGFPTGIEGEITVNGAVLPAAEWVARVATAIEREGGQVRARDADTVSFTGTTTPWGLAFSTSELSLADRGAVTVTADAGQVRFRYTLSTRRALVLATLTALVIVALLWRDAGPVWAPFGGIVIWGWLFGWNWLAQGWRAATLFEELGAGRD